MNSSHETALMMAERRLDDKMVSREHAQLTFKDQSWKIKQISEYGQMLVNGSAVSSSDLNNGDMITMGLLQGLLNTFVILFSRIIGNAY